MFIPDSTDAVLALMEKFNEQSRVFHTLNSALVGMVAVMESVNKEHPKELWLGSEYVLALAALDAAKAFIKK